jgi:Zn-finger nucleic acid-binding protein
MNCPRCHKELKQQTIYRDIEVDTCPQCQGIWLEFEELDQLEDTVFDRDELKGTTIFDTWPAGLSCPDCGQEMKGFSYRYYDLKLDYCVKEHGFWLDKGEEQRVRELMKAESKNLARKFGMEERWGGIVRNLKSKSFFSKIKDLLR